MPIRDRVCPCGSDTPPEPQATDPTLSGTPDYRNQLPQEGSFKTHMCPVLTGMHKCIHMPWHTQAQEQVGRRLCGICRKGLTSPLAVSLLPALLLILVKSSLLLHLEKESVTAELSSGTSADVFILDEQSCWVWNSGLFLHHRDGCATSLSSSVLLRSWKPFGFLFSVWRLFCLSGGPSVLCHQYLTIPQGGGWVSLLWAGQVSPFRMETGPSPL